MSFQVESKEECDSPVEEEVEDFFEENDVNEVITASANGEKWTSIIPPPVGRKSSANLLRPPPGITAWATSRIQDDPFFESFNLIFSKDMLDTVRIETNREARRAHGDTWKEIIE